MSASHSEFVFGTTVAFLTRMVRITWALSPILLFACSGALINPTVDNAGGTVGTGGNGGTTGAGGSAGTTGGNGGSGGGPIGFMHTEGAHILAANGEVVRLTGLSWFGMETWSYAPHGLWQRSMDSILDQI